MTSTGTTLQVTIVNDGAVIEAPGCPYEPATWLYGAWVIAELRREADRLEAFNGREGEDS